MSRAILLVDHGSRRPAANALLEDIATKLRERVPDRVVQVAHMELAEPSIADGIAACVAAGAREIVVHPYFLAPGGRGANQACAAALAGARTAMVGCVGEDDWGRFALERLAAAGVDLSGVARVATPTGCASILVDGEVKGSGTRTTVSEVFRGAHSVAAEVVDESGRVMMRSEAVNFYVRQQSALFRRAN